MDGMEISTDELKICLDVLARIDELPVEHPDAVAVRRATARVFKSVKERRRAERKSAVQRNDRAVMARTATAAPGRVDDDTWVTAHPALTAGDGLAHATAGTLIRPRSCYVCKELYVDVDGFYHQLCPPCASLNHAKRNARTDLTGRRALLTGGRAKIGMHIALRLLRDGAATTITTRFPRDAARRFAAVADSADWLHRLQIYGIDLRQPAQVVALADRIAADGPLDILVNNAAQTVRRSPNAYADLVRAEANPLPAGAPPVHEIGGPPKLHPEGMPALLDAASAPEALASAPEALTPDPGALTPDRGALTPDAGGLIPDQVTINSWTQRVHEIDPVELLEVQLCNSTAPFILISRLRSALAASATARGRSYVVNVSAMEGVFGRGYKGPGHPHTNMAKAALNMLTRTSARELYETDRIMMTSVDTGWITDERPHFTRVRLAEDGFHAPLDLADGAARVYDPIVRGEAGEQLLGVFLKDYMPAQW